MPSLTVEISRFVDEHFPGFVECTLIDAAGTRHTIVDKVPIVTLANLSSTSSYPQPGAVRGEVEARWDGGGRAFVQFSTARPDGVESTSGLSTFVVFAEQVQA